MNHPSHLSSPTRRSSDLLAGIHPHSQEAKPFETLGKAGGSVPFVHFDHGRPGPFSRPDFATFIDRKSTRLNSSHVASSYAVFCLKEKSKDKEHRSFDRYR